MTIALIQVAFLLIFFIFWIVKSTFQHLHNRAWRYANFHPDRQRTDLTERRTSTPRALFTKHALVW